MNKLNVKRLKNRELIEDLFKNIESLGYTIKNKNYGDSYFLFEGEENSICHFNIKEIPRFKFAIWSLDRFDTIQKQIESNGIGYTWADSLEISPLSELVFFTQYERDIDKFKPSRSGFVTGLYRRAYIENDENKEEWYLYKLEHVLEYMKKHPIKSYIHVGCQNKYIWEEISGLKALVIFINDFIYHKKSVIETYIKTSIQIAKCKSICKKLHSFNYIITDQEDGYYPRIRLDIRRKPNINLDEYEHEYDLIDDFQYDNIDITVNAWEEYLDETSSSEDIEKDKNLEDRFNNLLNILKTEHKVILTNIKQ